MNYNMQYRPPMGLQTPEEKQMGMFLHLSQLANLLIPFAGIVIPIIIWQTQKDKTPAMDAHGKMIVNYMISCLLYGFISFFLIFFFFIGLIPLFAIGICSIVFPIIGGIKANNGELWEYPLTIKFLQ